MNYVIGLCKKTGDWPSTLSDHGYEVQLIEQSIRTSSSKIVIPDIIAVSNKYIHSLIFDCKGGTSVEGDQIERYKTLSKENFVNWIDVYSRDQLKFDVCFTDFADNHPKVIQQIENFPLISFGKDDITKYNSFKITALNNAFNSPILLTKMLPPLSYYPFSDADDKCIIIPHLLRALLSIATEKGRSGPDVLSAYVFDAEEVLQRVHKMCPCLSVEHKNNLKKKMQAIISFLREKYNDTFAVQLGAIQTRKGGYTLHATLVTFRNTCKKIIDDCEKQPLLTDYITKNK